MPEPCQLGRIFRRCHSPSIGACQYCGRYFCESHGESLENGEEICSRPRCQAKHVDVREHQVYREAAQARSALGFCAVEGCERPRWGQCSRCSALYCQGHLHEKMGVFRQGSVAIERPVSLCDHCLARRKLWARL